MVTPEYGGLASLLAADEQSTGIIIAVTPYPPHP